ARPVRIGSEDPRSEPPAERLDRNLEEMTGELRVVVTGVQVLFAFLLIVPFNSGFSGIGGFERGVYFLTPLLAALAAICTIGPSAQHRCLFRHSDKRHLVFAANRMVIAGLFFLLWRCAAACCWRGVSRTLYYADYDARSGGRREVVAPTRPRGRSS